MHEGGVGIEARAGGGFRFVRPDGREFEILRRAPAPDYEWTELGERLAADGIEIGPATAATRWRGERMDYELGVWVLCRQAERAREKRSDASDPSDPSYIADPSDPADPWGDVSAETSPQPCGYAGMD